jgi:hypothetical protein
MLALISLFALTLFTWAVAIWATLEEEEPPQGGHRDPEPGPEEEEKPADWRNAA